MFREVLQEYAAPLSEANFKLRVSSSINRDARGPSRIKDQLMRHLFIAKLPKA